MTITAANSSRFSLAIEGVADSFRLTRLEGTSGIGELCQYDIECASKSQKTPLREWLGQWALITIHDLEGGQAPRYLRGIVQQARFLDHGREYHRYQLQLVSSLWPATQRHNYRIFQGQTTQQIITRILSEHGIHGEQFQDLTQAAAARPYCTQYGESDYDFLSRLVAEEGWHLHYRHHRQVSTLVLAADNQAFAPKTGTTTLRFAADSSRPQDRECVHQLHSEHQLVTGAVRLGDYRFDKPSLSLDEYCATQSSTQYAALEYYDFPGRFQDSSGGQRLSALHLRQAEAQAHRLYLETHSIHCAAGQWLQLQGHPYSQLNRRYLIVHSRLLGEQPQSLESGASSRPPRCYSALICVPWEIPYLPDQYPAKPRVPGPHNAIVTGPPGAEIHTDEHGRIKVQFYWDREAQGDDTSSCWLRVNQPLAGVQWGAIAIPRVGQEVIVDFEHADPDRPVMTGRLYNGQNPPPYTLPQHQTRSTFKTLTTPGGGGFHELRVEDKAGAEQILIRSQKDLDLRIGNDYRSDLQRDQHQTVGSTLREEYGQNLDTEVGGNLTESGGRNLAFSCGGDLQLKVSGAHVLKAGSRIHIKAGIRAVVEAGSGISLKGGAGILTLDPAQIAMQGPLVRLNEGGGGSRAQAANPAPPEAPTPADDDSPGGRAPTPKASQTPLPTEIDFDKIESQATAQLAVLRQAQALGAPLVEECEDCALPDSAASETVQSQSEVTDSTPTPTPDRALLDSIHGKHIEPESLQHAAALLNEARKKLETTGRYEPTYSQAELKHLAQQGTLSERYMVTLQKKKAASDVVGFRRTSGRTTCWTTTFHQIRAADTDPELICDLNGMPYDPDAEYELIIIDRGNYYQQDGGMTIVPTYENTAALGKREFDKEFTAEQIEQVMSPEYSQVYAEILAEYRSTGKNLYKRSSVVEFSDAYFANEPEGKSLFLARHEHTMELGTNELFSGDGLTKTTGFSGYVPPGVHGSVETLTLEKNPATIADLEKNGSIKRILAKPISKNGK